MPAPSILRTLNEFCLAAAAIGRGRARLHQERGVARDVVARHAARGVADVEVARQEHIRAAPRERVHGQARPPDQIAFVMAVRHVEGMVRDDDLHGAGWACAEPLPSSTQSAPR